MTKATRIFGAGGSIVWILGSILGSLNALFILMTLAGLICVWVAFFRASRELSEPKIHRDFFIATVLYFIGKVLLTITLFGASMRLGKHVVLQDLSHINPIMGIVIIIFFIVASWFWYKASALLSKRTAVSLYKIGGGFILAGSCLMLLDILLFTLIGGIGQILQVIAFIIGTKTIPDDAPIAG